MKERPILFSATMVRALLDGSKTQTRRIMKPQPDPHPDKPGKHWWPADAFQTMVGIEDELQFYTGMTGDCCPYGRPGDRLWVRETFGYVSPDENRRPHDECNIEYRADLTPGCTDRPGHWPADECKGDPERPRWRPSIHMPRKASRIMLEIVSVRVERLNGISETDARAEGVTIEDCHMNGYCAGEFLPPSIRAYRELWEQINGAGSWAVNPWCWVITFRRVAS